MENIIKNKLLRQITQPGLTREQMVEAVYTMLPAGRVVGKIGGWIIRWRNDKPIVYRQASLYNTSQTEESVKNRNSMAVATFFAASLNKVELIKEIWKDAKVDGNCAYRKIIKYNKKYFVDNHPSINNSITPASHQFDMDTEVSFIFNKTVKVGCNSNKLNETLIVALVPFDPIKTGIREFEVITLIHSLTGDIELNLNEEQLSVCSKYKKYILYSAIVRKNNSEISWSNTVVTEGKFCVEQIADQQFILVLFLKPALLFDVRNRKSQLIRKAHPPPGALLVMKHDTTKEEHIFL